MTKRQTLPTEAQMKWLRRIALYPMMVTYGEGELPRYTLQYGIPIPQGVASLFIRKGWVIPEKDTIFDRPKSYRVRTLADL